jgi:hypothetical protein
MLAAASTKRGASSNAQLNTGRALLTIKQRTRVLDQWPPPQRN